MDASRAYLASSDPPKHAHQFSFFDTQVDILERRRYCVLRPGEFSIADGQHFVADFKPLAQLDDLPRVGLELIGLQELRQTID